MSQTPKLERWRAGAAPIEGLSEALIALSTTHASDPELARLRGALAPQLAAPTRSLAEGASAGALSGLTWSRVWPWLSVIAIGITALWTLTSHDAQPPQQRKAQLQQSIVLPKASPSPSASAPVPTLSATPSQSPAPAAAVAPSAARSTTKRRASESESEQVPSPALTPETELLLLRKAQSALNHSASTALELANEHAQLYPNGLFAQEREMLRIEAELTLGKRHEALARAHDFSERFGRSTYRARIDRLLGSHRALKDREATAPASTQ